MASDALEGPVPAPSGRGRPILDLLDKAIDIQTPLIRKNIARARQRNPEATPAEVVRTLERMYVSALAGTGAAVGGAAAAPAVGTGIALALSAGEAFSSLELSTLFVLSVAEVHGVRLDEIERRRTLVMGILLGQSGSATIGKVAERTGQHWGRQLVSKVPMATLRQINSVLGKNFITKYGTKQGIIVLGRVAPFGIGALIGGGANATVATLAVRAARHAFGPAPQSWPETWLEPTPPPRDSIVSGNSGSLRRAVMYGEHDLSSSGLFSGHFINFGYWKDLTPGERISVEARTESQANLYRTVLSRLQIDPSDVLLEVGCGIGVGAALALREFDPSAVWGLDYSQDQLDRARRVHAEMLAEHPDRLVLRQGSALALPFADSTFSKCFSVEAAQHFEDLATFATEAHRVLEPGGRLTVTTFFTPHATAIQDLRRLINTIDSGIDVVRPIDSFRDDLLRAGFADVHIENIGDHVWHGFDAWMEQTEFKNSWGRNWLKAHHDGLIDYYLVTANTE